MKRLLAIILVGTLLTACVKEPRKINRTIIASVGGAELTLEQARSDISPETFAADSVFAIASYRDRWIRDQIWNLEAKRNGFSNSPEVAFKADLARNQQIAHLFRRNVVELKAEISISEAEVVRFYESNKAQLSRPEPHIRFVLFRAKDLKTALEAKGKLSRGFDLEETASQYGLEAGNIIAESKKLFPVSSALSSQPQLRQYLLELKEVKEISPIKRVGEQFQFVQLLETSTFGGMETNDELFSKIRELLLIDKKRQFIQEMERELIRKAKAVGTIKTYIFPEENLESENN